MSEDKKVAFAYQLSSQFDDKTVVQINGNFHVGDDKAAMDAQFDTLLEVFERQRRMARIRETQSAIDKCDFDIMTTQNDIAENEKPNMDAKERLAQKNRVVTLENTKRYKATILTQLERLKKEAS